LTASTQQGATANEGVLTILYQKKAIAGSGTTPRTINIYFEGGLIGTITNCRSLSTSGADIWSHGMGGDIYYSLGNVGIGMTAPTDALTIVGRANTSLGYRVNSNNVFDGAMNLTAANGSFTGNVGIGIVNPTQKLSVAGTIETTVGIKFPDGTTQTTAYKSATVPAGSTVPTPPLCISPNSLHWDGSKWICDPPLNNAAIGTIKYITGANPSCPSNGTKLLVDWSARSVPLGKCTVPAGTQLDPTSCSWAAYPGCGGGNTSKCPAGTLYANAWTGIYCVIIN
jgi:hypothetical protein